LVLVDVLPPRIGDWLKQIAREQNNVMEEKDHSDFRMCRQNCSSIGPFRREDRPYVHCSGSHRRISTDAEQHGRAEAALAEMLA
jgi:CDGSH-type Zn-finger protein